jgi:hypothetical protein
VLRLLAPDVGIMMASSMSELGQHRLSYVKPQLSAHNYIDLRDGELQLVDRR